jgi:hypothetical protein
MLYSARNREHKRHTSIAEESGILDETLNLGRGYDGWRVKNLIQVR